MATARDYYEILGVSKSASDAELKAAYRKRALEWHPDRHREDKHTAEAKFKEINEAYEVLSDAQKKAAYDQYGHAAFQQGGFGNAAGPFGGGATSQRQGPFTYSYSTSGGQGFDFSDFGFSDPFDIFEQFFGGGASPFGGRQRARKQVYSMNIDFMDAVKGVSKEVDMDGKRKTIKIPAGVDEGMRIRFDDFDVVISVRPDSKFKRDGNDVYIDVSLSYPDAALGTVIEVPTIDEPVKLRVKPGVQPGTLMRLRGKGIPDVRGAGRGDEYVRLVVTVPTHLNHRQKELLEELRHDL
ncbi:MAG: DnaJ C-terminal domain-containing protein [Patescibacteria group bacterium]